MPAHQLTTGLDAAVLAVLGGAPLQPTALHHGLDLAHLAEAVDTYHAAGRAALDRANPDWRQLHIQFTDWSQAEPTTITHLAPLLHHADGAWWFMRKHPCWRLRVRTDAALNLDQTLSDLADHDAISRWWVGTYEPETAAFGGPTGIDIAHTLFCADSTAVLTRLGATPPTPGLGRRELTMTLCTTLLQGAGLEWYEQADAWQRVALERPLPTDATAEQLSTLAGDLRHLIRAANTHQPDDSSAWSDAFHHAGRDLRAANAAGTLHRGLRDILSYLIIFHWNRLGLPARTQAILATAAQQAILDRHTPTPTARPAPTRSAPLEQVMARFPLVRQHHRRCADLATRLHEIHHHATTCHQPTTVDDRVDRACTTWNLAALLAADCGLPQLAADLCRQQLDIFSLRWPVGGRIAIASLQPLVNLARLSTRAGDPTAAYDALTAISRGIHEQTTITVLGTTIDFSQFCPDLSAVDPWLRQVLRDDGTRALMAAHRFGDAARHALTHDDRPESLHQARQTRVVADIAAGRIDEALSTIAATTTEPWQEAVAACLRLLALATAGQASISDVATTIDAVTADDPDPSLHRVRLILATANIVDHVAPHLVGRLHLAAITTAHRTEDAYAAREILAEVGSRWEPRDQDLAERAYRAGLDRGNLDQTTLDDLTTHLALAKDVLMTSLEK